VFRAKFTRSAKRAAYLYARPKVETSRDYQISTTPEAIELIISSIDSAYPNNIIKKYACFYCRKKVIILVTFSRFNCAERICESSLLLVYSPRSSNSSERSRIRSATVQSAESDQCKV